MTLWGAGGGGIRSFAGPVVGWAAALVTDSVRLEILLLH